MYVLTTVICISLCAIFFIDMSMFQIKQFSFVQQFYGVKYLEHIVFRCLTRYKNFGATKEGKLRCVRYQSSKYQSAIGHFPNNFALKIVL